MTLNVTIKNTSTNGKKALVNFSTQQKGEAPTPEAQDNSFILANGEEKDVTLWDTRFLSVFEVAEEATQPIDQQAETKADSEAA